MPKKQTAQPLQIPIITGDKSSSEVDYRDSLLVNMHGVVKQIKGADGYIMSNYGITELASNLTGFDRGAIWNENLRIHYRVSGDRLIGVLPDGTFSDFGYIGGIGQVSLPYSFSTQAIIAAGAYYLHDGTKLTQVRDPDLGNPIDAVWIDGYYFFTDGDSLYHTDIGNEASVDGLKYSNAILTPDPLLGVGTTQDNKVIAFGRYTTEFFQNVGTAQFAFTRLSNRALKIGIVGTHCKVEMAATWYIIGGRKDASVSIYALGPSGEQRIATREIDKILTTYSETELSYGVMESREQDAAQFITVRLARHTLMFNLTLAQAVGANAAWSVMQIDPMRNKKMPIANGVFDPRISKWVFGESNNNRVGYLDSTVSTYYGDTVEQTFYTPQINLEDVSLREIELDTIAGFTADEATVLMSISYDGLAYGMEYSMLYGSFNSHNKRFKIRRLGNVSKDFSFKFRSTSKSRLIFSNLKVTYG